MGKDRSPLPVRSGDTHVLVAWLQGMVRQVRLAWRLLLDERVPVWTKLIPPAALAYVLLPLDILPDVALGLGQLDDVAVLLIGTKLFIELAPQDVVREHLLALGARLETWHVVDEEGDAASTVIDGQFQIDGPDASGADEPGEREG